MSKVAILGSRGYPSHYGGFETLVRHLAPGLADRGWDVTVYNRPGCLTGEGDPRIATREVRGIDIKSASTLSYGWSGARDVVRLRPDVALVLNVANGFWLRSLQRAGIPSVVNVDGVEWERAKWNALAKAMFRRGARLSARTATHLVCDATAIDRYWRSHLGRGGVVIPYGADPPPALPVPAGSTHRGYVLLVARFVPENTVEEFFRAVPELSRHYPVVLVGSSGYGGPFDEWARDLDDGQRVHWLGHVADDTHLNSLWQHAGVYFHGHSVGGTNPALVQAMACGAPVVARDTKYNREVLSHAGHYVQPNPAAIVEGIVSVMTCAQEQERMARLAMGRAAEHYTWSDIIDKYDECLTSAIQGAEEITHE